MYENQIKLPPHLDHCVKLCKNCHQGLETETSPNSYHDRSKMSLRIHFPRQRNGTSVCFTIIVRLRKREKLRKSWHGGISNHKNMDSPPCSGTISLNSSRTPSSFHSHGGAQNKRNVMNVLERSSSSVRFHRVAPSSTITIPSRSRPAWTTTFVAGWWRTGSWWGLGWIPPLFGTVPPR